MLKILPQFYYFILLLYSVSASADILAALAALVDVCSALLKPPSLHRASNETGFPGPRMKQFSYLILMIFFYLESTEQSKTYFYQTYD